MTKRRDQTTLHNFDGEMPLPYVCKRGAIFWVKQKASADTS